MYKVNPFLIHDLESKEAIIQTNSSTVLISNTMLIQLLKKIEINNLEKISEYWLSSNECDEEMILFLLDNNILIKVADILPNQIHRIVCCSNNLQFRDFFKLLFDSKYEIICLDIEMCYQFKFDINDVCVFFLEPFLYTDLLKLADYVKEKNLLSKFIFYYNYSIYISNFYKKDWHIPCPKCFFSNLENHLRGNQITDKMNFQLLIDLIYRKKTIFPIETKLYNYDFMLLMYLLQSQFSSLNARENYVLFELCEIALQTNTLTKDQAVYWEICDCYE